MEGVQLTHQGLKAHSSEGSAGRITQAGLAARSTQGTAAKGMAIKGHEDLWVEIQANTFRNWVNETLKPVDIKVGKYFMKHQKYYCIMFLSLQPSCETSRWLNCVFGFHHIRIVQPSPTYRFPHDILQAWFDIKPVLFRLKGNVFSL